MARLPGPVSWVGGKGNMISKLTPLIPYTKLYVEPFGGAGSILMNRTPSPVEVFNDLDGRLVNLMRTLQDPKKFEKFCMRLEMTLYSLEEFSLALDILHNQENPSDEDLAWAFFVGMNQGFGGWIPRYEGNWGRSLKSSKGQAATVSKWLSRLDKLNQWHDRVSRCQIDHRDGLEVIKYWDYYDKEEDEWQTTFYIDPPYALETRKYENEGGHSYVKEPDIAWHAELVELLLKTNGAVVLSCYDHPVYQPLVDNKWEQIQFNVTSTAAGRKRGSKLYGKGTGKEHAARVETVYRNAKAVELTKQDGV